MKRIKMTNELQILIAEQKILTAKFDELLKKVNTKPYAFIGNSEYWKEIKKYLDPKDNDNLYRFKDKASLYLNIDDVIICDNATDKFRLLVSQTHTIIDLNEQPDFFEKLNNPDPKKVYIKGHPTRGVEVIKTLKDLGGIDKGWCSGNNDNLVYFINYKRDGYIDWLFVKDFKNIIGDYTEFRLPEEVNEIEPPKEKVELIKGEVYMIGDYIGIFKERISNNHTKWYCALESKRGLKCYETSYGQCLNAKIATPEQRKQIFDALEKAGKHFDKENMRLLDVKEWNCDEGHPVIVRLLSSSYWKVEIFTDYDILMCDFGFVVPYNDETKHLVGTTDNPDKYYKFVTNGEF